MTTSSSDLVTSIEVKKTSAAHNDYKKFLFRSIFYVCIFTGKTLVVRLCVFISDSLQSEYTQQFLVRDSAQIHSTFYLTLAALNHQMKFIVRVLNY
jgi:hypothetical protein